MELLSSCEINFLSKIQFKIILRNWFHPYKYLPTDYYEWKYGDGCKIITYYYLYYRLNF